MIAAIVNGLFNLIANLASLLTTPLVSAISALIPRIWYNAFNDEDVFAKIYYVHSNYIRFSNDTS